MASISALFVSKICVCLGVWSVRVSYRRDDRVLFYIRYIFGFIAILNTQVIIFRRNKSDFFFYLSGSEEFHNSDRALKAVNAVVHACNEGTRKMERTEQMYYIQKTLSFKIKPIALVSNHSRWLVKKGSISVIRLLLYFPLKNG